MVMVFIHDFDEAPPTVPKPHVDNEALRGWRAASSTHTRSVHTSARNTHTHTQFAAFSFLPAFDL